MRSIYSGFFPAIVLSMILSLSLNAQSSFQDYVVDRNFGTTCGFTSNSNPFNPNYNELFKLSNGKYIVVGDFYESNANAFYILFARFNSDGSVDSSFGVNGVVQQTFNGRNDVKCALMSNDKIYVAGYESNSNAYSSFRAYLARFNSDGTADTTFNGVGRVVETNSVNPVSCSFYTHLLLQPDGKIVALGYEAVNINGGADALIARRYDLNGNPDPSFHPSVTYPGFPIPFYNIHSKGILNTQDQSMRFLYTTNLNNTISSIKLDSLGEPISTYGSSGVNNTSIVTERSSTVIRYFSDSQGRIYAQVPSTNINQDIRIVRLDSLGNPDSTFSGDGVLDVIDYPGTNLSERGFCLHLDNSGRLWTMGNGSFAFSQPNGIIYRYDQSGAIDSTFEGTGYTAISEFSGTVFKNVYFETDDEFVINTNTNGSTGLLKLRLSNGVISIVNAGTDTICTGGQTALSVIQPSNCYSYQWKKDGVDFGSLNDTTITVTAAGTYLIVASAGNDVITSDSIVVVEEICTNVNEVQNENTLNIYPNPSTDKINIETKNIEASFLIIDLTGRVIKTIVNQNGLKEITVSLDDISPGIYIVQTAGGSLAKSIYKVDQ